MDLITIGLFLGAFVLTLGICAVIFWWLWKKYRCGRGNRHRHQHHRLDQLDLEGLDDVGVPSDAQWDPSAPITTTTEDLSNPDDI